MVEINQSGMLTLLRKYELANVPIYILTKSGLHYFANSLRVFEDSIFFLDKHGDEVLLSLSEILQVTKARGYNE